MLVPRGFIWLVQQQKLDIVRRKEGKDVPFRPECQKVVLKDEWYKENSNNSSEITQK